MSDATPEAGFGRADLTTFCRLDELGLEVTGQRLEPDRAVLACRVVEPEGSDERWCRRCGCEGAPAEPEGAGSTLEEIQADFPFIEAGDIQQAAAYAASSVRE